jgi:hypothetical protein
LQNSELYRRGIVCPLTAEVEGLLRCSQGDLHCQVQLLSIDTEEFFESIWELGLFEEINQQTGALIDDYEEEFARC